MIQLHIHIHTYIYIYIYIYIYQTYIHSLLDSFPISVITEFCKKYVFTYLFGCTGSEVQNAGFFTFVSCGIF